MIINLYIDIYMYYRYKIKINLYKKIYIYIHKIIINKYINKNNNIIINKLINNNNNKKK